MKSIPTGISVEYVDKINTSKSKVKYKQVSNFELLGITAYKSEGYYWLQINVDGDLGNRTMIVTQTVGLPVVIEKVNELLFKFQAPLDEVVEVRTFTVYSSTEVGVIKSIDISEEPDIYTLTSGLYPVDLSESFTESLTLTTLEQTAMSDSYESYITATSSTYDPSDSDAGSATASKYTYLDVGSNQIFTPRRTVTATRQLTFESGLTDTGSVNGSVWLTTGTPTIQYNGKISGVNSMKFGELGDSLYTETPYFTGGATKFNLEFSFFARDTQTYTSDELNPLCTVVAANGIDYYSIGFSKDDNRLMFQRNYSTVINTKFNTKIHFNEISRLALSYTGTALKVYLNDVFVGEVVTTLDPLSRLALMSYGVTGKDAVTVGFLDNIVIQDAFNKTYTDIVTPAGAVKLELNNDLVDSYGNSTWTNSGLSFDSSNSVNNFALVATGVTGFVKSSDISIDLLNNKLEVDFKSSDLSAASTIVSNRYISIGTSSTGAIYIEFLNNGSLMSSFTTRTILSANVWYSFKVYFYNTRVFLVLNDTVIDTIVSPYSWMSPTLVSSVHYISGDFNENGKWFNGYVERFSTEKGTLTVSGVNDLMRNYPTLSLAMESDAYNTGNGILTVATVGTPGYGVFDTQKGMKFTSVKYLRLAANTLYNFGTNTDFCLDFNIYIVTINRLNNIISNHNTSGVSTNFQIRIGTTNRLEIVSNGVVIASSNTVFLGTYMWNNIKISRRGNVWKIVINYELDSTFTSSLAVNLSNYALYIGTTGWNTSAEFADLGMSCFRLYTCASDIPRTPPTNIDKRAFELDFKPTGKANLLKDNSGKGVLTPMGINSISYDENEYCCYFNGVDQYIRTGINEHFNVQYDTCLLKIRFKMTDTPVTAYTLLSSASAADGGGNVSLYITPTGSVVLKLLGTAVMTSLAGSIVPNTIYEVMLCKSSNLAATYMYINNKIVTSTSSANAMYFNLNSNTYIGRVGHNTTDNFKGYIYSILMYENNHSVDLYRESPTVDSGYYVFSFDFENRLTARESGMVFVDTNSSVPYVPARDGATDRNNTAVRLGSTAASYLTYSGTTFNSSNLAIDLIAEFKIREATTNGTLLSSGEATIADGSTRVWHNSADNSLRLTSRISGVDKDFVNYKGIMASNWVTMKLLRINNVVFTYINDALVDQRGIGANQSLSLGGNSLTYIGTTGWSQTDNDSFKADLNFLKFNKTGVRIRSDVPCKYQIPLDGVDLIDTGYLSNIWTTVGSPTPSVVDSVNCYKFNSTNYLSTPINIGGSFVISTRIYIPTSVTSGSRVPIFGGSAASGDTFIVYATDSTIVIANSSATSTAVAYTPGTWFDLKVNKSGTTLFLRVGASGLANLTASLETGYINDTTFYLGYGVTSNVIDMDFYLNNFSIISGITLVPQSIPTPKYKTFHLDCTANYDRSHILKDSTLKNVISHSPTVEINNLVSVDGYNCVAFNGIDQYLSVNYPRGFNFESLPYAITLKVFPTSTSTTQTLFSNAATDNGTLVQLTLDGTAKTISYIVNGTTILTSTIKMYSWNSILIKFVDGVLTLRVGSTDTTYNGTLATNLGTNNEFRIGNNPLNTSTTYFKGYITDLKTYRGRFNEATFVVDSIDNTLESTVVIPNPPIVVTYPIEMNSLDVYGEHWTQLNIINPIVLREYGTNNTAMLLDGTQGLLSSNRHYRLGTSKFTLELDFTASELPTTGNTMPIISYGKGTGVAGWYELVITEDGRIKFGTPFDNNYVTTSADSIASGTKYRLAVTRDDLGYLRIFLNGIKSAEDIYKVNLGGKVADAPEDMSNALLLGRLGSAYNNVDSNYGFKGYIDNFHMVRGVVKYVNNYSVSSISTTNAVVKTLLNASSGAIGTSPGIITDSGDGSITWTNTGVNVTSFTNLRPASYTFSGGTNRLVSNASSNFTFNDTDLTVDLTFSPTQTTSEAVLLDMRQLGSQYQGISVVQPDGNADSLTISIGSDWADTSAEIVYNTGAGSLVSGIGYHLRIVRNLDKIYIILDGVLKATFDIGMLRVYTRSVAILGNDSDYAKGFTGHITQFRVRKGIAAGIHEFTKLTEELK